MDKLPGAKPFAIAVMGLPGSGKSTFLQQLAYDFDLFYWQNDEARRQMFPSPSHSDGENILLKRSAMYVFSQLLQNKQSLIYDINFNKRRSRKQFAKFADQHGAEYLLVWVKVDIETVKARVVQRAETTAGSLGDYYKAFRPDLVEHMQSHLQEPSESESYIVIDGLAEYVVQKQQFIDGLYESGLR